MKIFKRIWWVLALVLVGSLFVVTSQKALADTTENASDIQACISSMLLTNPATITCKDSHGGAIPFTDSNPNDGIENYAPPSGLFCNPGDLPATTHAIGGFGINLAGSSSDNTVPADLIDPGILTSHTVQAFVNLGYGNCTGYVIPGGSSNEITIPVSGSFVAPSVAGLSAPVTTNTTPTNGNDCETSYTGAAKALNWISCQILAGIDGLIGELNGFIENQLFLCTGKSITTGATCNNNLLTTSSNHGKGRGVEQVWSIFRVLASAILVIIMLIMVLSEALSFGPFDAYTVRKLLPKLVAAVILMQLSWYIFKFAIDVSNDVGRGIADLMYYPFGGSGVFSLDNLIGGLGKWAPNLTVASTGITVGLLAAFGGLTTFGFMFLGISAAASIFVGVLVLLFRQLLVILCMMLAPIALAAWILPGTKKYWDMWKDNFTKLIFMFPMIMAMIAAGRIFAYLGSQSGGLTGMFIVLIGVFGPYWFLPKTFKWGGQAFGALAGGAWQGTQKYRAAPGKYAMGKAKQNREWRRNERNRQISDNPDAAPRWKKALSGAYNPLLGGFSGRGGGAQDHQFAHTVAEGKKTAQESVAEEVELHGLFRLDHDKMLEDLDDLQQGKVGRHSGIDATNNKAIQAMAFDKVMETGDPKFARRAMQGGDFELDTAGNIVFATDADGVRRAQIQKGTETSIDPGVLQAGINRNFSKFNQIATDMGLAPQLSGWAADKMPEWKDDTWDQWDIQYDQGLKRDMKPGSKTYGKLIEITDPAERQKQIEETEEQARALMSNPNTFGRLSPERQEKVRARAAQSGPVETGRGTYILPTGAELATNPGARQAVIRDMGNPAATGAAVRRTLAEKVVQAHLDPTTATDADRAGYAELLTNLRDSPAPEAQAMAAGIETNIEAGFQQHMNDTRVKAAATGAKAPELTRVTAAAQARIDKARGDLGLPMPISHP